MRLGVSGVRQQIVLYTNSMTDKPRSVARAHLIPHRLPTGRHLNQLKTHTPNAVRASVASAITIEYRHSGSASCVAQRPISSSHSLTALLSLAHLSPPRISRALPIASQSLRALIRPSSPATPRPQPHTPGGRTRPASARCLARLRTSSAPLAPCQPPLVATRPLSPPPPISPPPHAPSRRLASLVAAPHAPSRRHTPPRRHTPAPTLLQPTPPRAPSRRRCLASLVALRRSSFQPSISPRPPPLLFAWRSRGPYLAC